MDKIDILFVEDDEDLQTVLTEYLRLSGFSVTPVASALECFSSLCSKVQYRVAVVDLGLPDLDGLRLVEHIRQNTCLPIIVITARGTSESTINGYRAGADIYMRKPVKAAELVAAIGSLLDRQSGRVNLDRTNTEWCLNRSDWTMTSPTGSRLTLSVRDFKLLEMLAQSDGQIVDRESMCRALYSRFELSSEAALASQVRRLRARLREICAVPVIKTAHGQGYALALPVAIR